MIVTIDHNLKQVDFHLYDMTGGKPRLLNKLSAPMDAAGDKKALVPLIKELEGMGPLEAVGIRLRFGGDLYGNPARIDDAFLSGYPALTPYFPFYVPLTHVLLKELAGCFSTIPFYAFFETALFRDLPEEEKRYAIPQEYSDKFPIRRYGYNGLYHACHAAQMDTQGTVLSIVLDKQTTVCTVRQGKPLYISVGYTPLEGVMGRTTCGDLDPGVAFYLLRDQKQSFYWIDNLLKKESGFKGLTGFDLDIDDLFIHAGNEPAVRKAFEIYFNQILRHAGQALAVSGPLSGLVFGGRYCDALQPIIHRFAKKLSFFGIRLKTLPWASRETGMFEATEPGSEIPVRICRTPLPEIIYQMTKQAIQKD